MDSLPSEKKKKNRYRFGIPLILAVGISVLINQFPLHNLESYLYDLRLRLSPTTKTSGMIETITITKDSLRALGGDPTAGDLANALVTIAADQPKAIMTLIPPDQFTGTAEEIESLVTITKKLQDRLYIVGGPGDYPARGLEEELRLRAPFDFLSKSLGSWTSDRQSYARDYVTRRIILNHSQRPTVIPLLAKKMMSLPEDFTFRGQFTKYFSEDVYSDHLFIDYRPSGTYPNQELHQVLNRNQRRGRFSNKVVIIGDDTKARTTNYSRTPLNSDVLAMTKVETHANMLDTALLNTGRWPLPQWADIAVTTLISFITLYIVLSVKPTIGLLALAITLIVFTFFSMALMAFAGLWMNMIHPYLAVFICYYFSIPYRLIIENRRSWEYYQKHRLLKQVEELKTNFLSMMSHDLKTPIARIQGMSEILMTEKDRLSTEQVDAVERITLSAEELSGFISTVLDLGRIENQKVKLKIQSKDVNALLKDVVKKHEFLAKKKEIEVVLDLEPLFSVKMDIELMRQVFANLVENAIKYSPEKSKVLISSEELEGRIQVQVADQGEGIKSEELPNVFMKFYRSKNARSSTTKGSGLGLYLAKYFIDLHHGKISVESTLGVGTTFTVELPTENAIS